MQTINSKNLKTEKVCNEREGFGYVYITTNNITGVKYIGQRFSKQIKGSFYDDIYLGSGIVLNRAIKKYGKENFSKEIVQICNSKEELNEAEKYWINYYKANINSNSQFYNIAAGGAAGDNWTGKSNEYKEYFKQIISTSNRQRKRNPDNIKGNKNPAYGKKWCNDGIKNYLLCHEEIKARNLTLGLLRTKEHNQKISKSHKGKKHNYSSTQSRICYNNGIVNIFIYPSDIEEYETAGWVKGMIRKRQERCNELPKD